MRKSMMKIPTLPTKAPNQAKLSAQQVHNFFLIIFQILSRLNRNQIVMWPATFYILFEYFRSSK